MAHIAFESLSFTYPSATRLALEDVSFGIEAGSFTLVCGRSGCGKTTLLRHLKPALAPYGRREGCVLLGGVPVDELSAFEQVARIGFVMQSPAEQLVTDKVWHELAFGLESLGVDEVAMRARVAEMASYFGIEDWFHRGVNELSGGQKQLLNLASVMVMDPEVLVLDEPISQLDPVASADFLMTLRKLNLDLGLTVVMTAHRLDEVFEMADQVIVLEDGRVVVSGSPRAVAERLHFAGSDMSCALPAPARAFLAASAGLGEGRMRQGSEACHSVDALERVGGASPEHSACPLSVREGRMWLSSLKARGVIAACAIPETLMPDKPANPCALELSDVWLRYDRDAADVLRGISFRADFGRVHAVVGGNGAGKSTLLRVAAGLAKPYRGSVRVMGRKLGKWRSDELYRGGVALLPQDPRSLFAKDTVRDELREMLSTRALPEEDVEARIRVAARRVGVGGLLGAHPLDLSGGEQQKVALAKVLLAEPRVLLLDEPTKGLDAFFKREFADLIRGIAADGAAVVMVSHDVDFCATCADEVSLLFDGSVAASNVPRRFFSCNAFYTTAASRMSRGVLDNAVTVEDVVGLCAGR